MFILFSGGFNDVQTVLQFRLVHLLDELVDLVLAVTKVTTLDKVDGL